MTAPDTHGSPERGSTPATAAGFDTATRRESPTVFAKRIGLTQKPPRHSSSGVLSWDGIVDLAVASYWTRRGAHAA